LLIKTNLPNRPERCPDDVRPVTHDGAAYMAEWGVQLVCVDPPAVDGIYSKDSSRHHALYEHDICICEGVILDHVSGGEYELIALPLAMKEADGSPVRAVIRSVEEEN